MLKELPMNSYVFTCTYSYLEDKQEFHYLQETVKKFETVIWHRWKPQDIIRISS